MAIKKIISSFDGVWYNPENEAKYIWNYIINKTAVISNNKPELIDSLLQKCQTEMDKSPYEYGFFNNNYLSIYYKENLFFDIFAVFDYINKNASTNSYSKFKQELAFIKNAIEKKTLMNLFDYCKDCFNTAAKNFKIEGKVKPNTSAGKIFNYLTSTGTEILLLSDNDTEKIEHIITKTGLKISNEKSIIKTRLHSIGNINRPEIDNNYTKIPEIIKINIRYNVYLRRPKYYRLLIKEKPDYVIGDNFSLDISIPLFLILNETNFQNLKVILKKQSYTPEWVLEFLSKNELKKNVYIIDTIDQIPSLLK